MFGLGQTGWRFVYPTLREQLSCAYLNPRSQPTGNKLFDTSPNNNHGDLTNMDPATDWVITEHGWAMDWDGSDDYVNVGKLVDWLKGFGDDDRAISFWWKCSATTSVNRIMGVLQGTPGPAVLIDSGRDNDGDIEVFVRHNGAGTTRLWFTTATGGHNDGTWKHIVINKGATVAKSSIWINGMPQGITNQDDDTVSTTNMDRSFYIGGANIAGVLDADLAQQMMDIRLYARQLNSGEVATLCIRPGIADEMEMDFPIQQTISGGIANLLRGKLHGGQLLGGKL